jgi:hypothetical protein
MKTITANAFRANIALAISQAIDAEVKKMFEAYERSPWTEKDFNRLKPAIDKHSNYLIARINSVQISGVRTLQIFEEPANETLEGEDAKDSKLIDFLARKDKLLKKLKCAGIEQVRATYIAGEGLKTYGFQCFMIDYAGCLCHDSRLMKELTSLLMERIQAHECIRLGILWTLANDDFCMSVSESMTRKEYNWVGVMPIFGLECSLI